MKKRKILILLYAYYPYANANTNVMQPHIEKMKDIFDVTIFSQRNSKDVAKTECRDGITIVRYDKPMPLLAPFFAIEGAFAKKKRVLWKRVALVFIRFVNRILWLSEKSDEYRLLRNLVNTNDYDLVLATCASYVSLLNVLSLKKSGLLNGKMVSYFMDPHAYYIRNTDNVNELVKQESQIYEYSDLVLTTEEIYRDNQTNVFRQYIDKTRPIPFANLRINTRTSPISSRITGIIKCVYAGSLIDLSVRNPEYFYRIVSTLDDRFEIFLICKSINAANKRLYDKYLLRRSNVKLMVNLSLEDSLAHIDNADILINFGNRVTNQTPSKIFDYIATGHPIVNFHSIEEDTAKFYLLNYDYKLNIFEQEDAFGKNATKFIKFCIEHSNKRMDPGRIRDLYYRYTSEVSTEIFIREIKRVLGD